jgi:hypothetical protein
VVSLEQVLLGGVATDRKSESGGEEIRARRLRDGSFMLMVDEMQPPTLRGGTRMFEGMDIEVDSWLEQTRHWICRRYLVYESPLLQVQEIPCRNWNYSVFCNPS